MKKLQILGMLIVFSSLATLWIVYDWKLMIIILCLLWGNNIEQRGRIRSEIIDKLKNK